MNDKSFSEGVYFKNKADEVFEAILSDCKKSNFSDVEIKSYIYIALKEVARDQRYAIIADINEEFHKLQFSDLGELDSIIQNAQIKEK